MKKIVLLLVVASGSVWAQSSYHDYKTEHRTCLYLDQYEDDRNQIAGVLDDLKLKKTIKEGYLELVNWDNSQGKYTFISQEIETSRDFQLETRFQFAGGENRYGMEFQWGKDEEGNNFGFHISANAHYWVGKYEASLNKYIAFEEWKKSALVHQGNWNKITIRKVKDRYYMFLNESLVYECSFQAFFGDRIAFAVPQKTTMRVDYLKIDYLEKAHRPQSPQPSADLNLSAFVPKGKRVA